jgi:chromatin remodeling complex protein RSC6
MAPTKQTKKTETPVAAPAPAETPKVASKKAASKKEEVVAPAPVVEAPKKVVAPKVEEEGEKKERRVVSKESLHTDFEGLLTKIHQEIERLREAKPKAKGSKFLKTINKDVKQLHADVLRVTKFKKNGSRKTSTSSGFLKPVTISPELAKFTKWDASKEYSRTQVTKFICTYIKTNKLFEEKDKRNIVCDTALKNLLKYDPANPPKDENGKAVPLTYFRLQQYLKSHFKTVQSNVTVEEDLE